MLDFKKKVIIITRGLRVFQRKKLAYFQNDAIKIPKGLKKLDTHTNIVRKNKGHKQPRRKIRKKMGYWL